MQETLTSWLFAPPCVLIIGSGARAEQLVKDLAASGRIDDEMLQASYHPDWTCDGERQMPLRNVRGVVLDMESEEEPALLLRWRHARVWEWVRAFGKGAHQRIRWVILCSSADAEEVSKTPLAGNGKGAATFGRFTGYTVLSIREEIDPIEETRAALSSVTPTDLVTWEALQRADKGRIALISLRDSLQDENLDGAALMAVLRTLRQSFDEQLYEIDGFCRPNCHKHGGQWRKWLNAAIRLPVTENVTHIVQSGRALLPLLHL